MTYKYFFILAVSLFLFLSDVYPQNSGKIKDITILHWNDLHARNLPFKISKKDSATGKDNSYFVGGISNMLGYLNKFRNDKTISLNGGDDFQGTPISTLTRGKSQIEFLNMLKPDAFVIGNHEFDYGQYALDSALMEADFDFLSANVFLKTKNKTIGKPWVIKKINGVKCGIIGLTAFDLMTLTLPANVSDIEMLNSDSVIAAGIKYLKKKKCDVIILLTHIGTDNDKKLAAKFSKDVDIIIGGHSHTPLFEPVIENGVIIGQAGSYSRWLGKIDLKVDTKKDTIISFDGRLYETKMDSSLYDKAAQRKVENMISSIQGDLLRVIGKLESDWKRSYNDESNLGQWEADATRIKVNADISLMNSGGLRKDLAEGDITVGDIWEINPFGNTVVTFNISGEGLTRMFKNNLKNRVNEIKETGSGDMIIVSGINIVYDSRKVLDGNDDFLVSFKVNGEDLDEDKMYKIATNNYVGAQFKKYFGEVTEEIIITDNNIIDRDLLIEAVENQKVINSVLEKRIEDISKQEIKN